MPYKCCCNYGVDCFAVQVWPDVNIEVRFNAFNLLFSVVTVDD